jgi:hypothetical protein
MFAWRSTLAEPTDLESEGALFPLDEPRRAALWDLEPQPPYFWAQLADDALTRGNEKAARDHILFAYLAADRLEKRRS